MDAIRTARPFSQMSNSSVNLAVLGAALKYTHWASGQPSSLVGGLEDCALLQTSSGGTWHDYPCHGFLLSVERHGWVCKFGRHSFIVFFFKLFLRLIIRVL